MVSLCKDCNGIACGVVDVAVAAESDAAEAEGGGFVLGSGVAVFSGTHEEVESNPYDVYNALCLGVAVDVVFKYVVHDSGWEWFDAFWQRVCSSAAA